MSFLPDLNIDSLSHLPPGEEWRHSTLGLRRQLSAHRDRGEPARVRHHHIHHLPLHRPRPHGGDSPGGLWTVHSNRLTTKYQQSKCFTAAALQPVRLPSLHRSRGGSDCLLQEWRTTNDSKTVFRNLLLPYIIKGKHAAYSMGAMSILTSFTFLVDVTWSMLDIFRK